jgi:endonuclease-8
MPEGDSYTLAAARIRPVLVGRTVTSVTGAAPDVRRHSGSIEGAEVTEVRTLGKHLMIDLANGLTIHIHLGMPGRVVVRRLPAGDGPAVRLALNTDAGSASVLAAPTVEVDRRKVVDHELRRVGPDLLANEFDWHRFRHLAAIYPAGRTVSDFLLDQRVMAGIGNVYRCETLFLEGIEPRRSMDQINPAQRDGLAERARRLMLANAQRPGRATTGDGRLWVYERAGRPCRRCRTEIMAAWIGEPARITYWCPICQP